MPLSFDRYRELIRSETVLAQEAFDRVEPDEPVPTCPDWPASELRDHMAGVLAFWHRQLELADPLAGDPDFPPEIRERYRLPLAELAEQIERELIAAGPDRPCWNWSGQNLVSGWVARRMANEMAVHRVDMQSVEIVSGGRAFSSVTPIPDDLAVDGIDEVLDGFAAAKPDDLLDSPTVLALESPGRRWIFELDSKVGIRHVEPALGVSPDALVIGPAHDVLLHLWGRPAAVRISGDPEILTTWRSLPLFS